MTVKGEPPKVKMERSLEEVLFRTVAESAFYVADFRTPSEDFKWAVTQTH